MACEFLFHLILAINTMAETQDHPTVVKTTTPEIIDRDIVIRMTTGKDVDQDLAEEDLTAVDHHPGHRVAADEAAAEGVTTGMKDGAMTMTSVAPMMVKMIDLANIN